MLRFAFKRSSKRPPTLNDAVRAGNSGTGIYSVAAYSVIRYNAGMELNLTYPKIVVTLVIVAWALITGYMVARQRSLTPTLGDTLLAAMMNSPFLLFLGSPFVWML